jgi:hypothetical protein
VACSQKSDSDASQTTPVGETSPRDSLMVEIVAEDSLDILSLLQSDHVVIANSSMMGAFVTSIDSVASGGDCFWLFSVNGEMAQAACDKMMVGSGDTVRWHFRCQGD